MQIYLKAFVIFLMVSSSAAAAYSLDMVADTPQQEMPRTHPNAMTQEDLPVTENQINGQAGADAPPPVETVPPGSGTTTSTMPTNPPIIDPITGMTPPDTTTQPEGCFGPDTHRVCTHYDDSNPGRRTVTIHSENVVSDTPAWYEATIWDSVSSQVWNPASGFWNTVEEDETTFEQRIMNWNPVLGDYVTENSHTWTTVHKYFDQNGVIGEFTWKTGEVGRTVNRPNANGSLFLVVENIQYTFTEMDGSGLWREGFEEHYTYDANDVVDFYHNKIYTGFTVTETTTTPNGCTKTITERDVVIYSGACTDDPAMPAA